MGLRDRITPNAADRKRKRDEQNNRRVARLAKRGERKREEKRTDTTRETGIGDATSSSGPDTSA
jgi:hypothetical protein